VFSHVIFWPWFAGVVILVAGLVAARRSVSSVRGIEKLVALGPIFYAAPLAAFGAEHLSSSRSISQVVPAWMPAPLFWTFLVGVALILAAASIVLRIYSHLSATLLGIMFTAFVCMIHIPNVVANPGNRIFWAVALRDLAFAGGALALAAMWTKRLRMIARIFIGVPLLFFAAEHFLHPRFAPGVPLQKTTPVWVPIPMFWGILTGAALVASGVTMLVARNGKNRIAKCAHLTATLLGLLIVLLVVFLYLPIFLIATPPAMLEGINYVADTLLLGGTVLLAAALFPS
jgi:uncharacterized membrane protein